MRYLLALALCLVACTQTPHHEPVPPPAEPEPRVEVPAQPEPPAATIDPPAPMPEPSIETAPLPEPAQPLPPVVAPQDTPPEVPQPAMATPAEPEATPEPEAAPEPDLRTRLASLLLAGDGESLARAEALLPELEAEPGVSESWLRLVKALIAESAGEPAEVAANTRAAWLHALAQLPMRIGASHIADDIGTSAARDSISFRPESYVSTAFQASRFGVREREDGRWDFHLKVSARLLDEEGREVTGFKPPASEYTPQQPGSVPCNGPAEQPTWFVFELQQPLPRDLRAGNYVVELTVTDLWKPATSPQQIRLDIRVR